MKRFFSLVCLSMLVMAASAQITWNAKAGIGVATCYGNVQNLESHFVGKAGVGIEKPLSANWSLMPSLEFAAKGAKEGEQNFNFYYLQIPVMAAYRINLTEQWNTTLKVGPYFAYQISNDVEVDDHVKKFDAGLDVGVDFEHGRFVCGAEIEWGITPMTEVGDLSIKNLAFYATIGWKF